MLGVDAPTQEKRAVLQRCIESFNALDAEHHFIETVEREQIIEELTRLRYAVGLGEREDLADEWRDW